MVISKKPLQIILAIAMALMPFVNHANSSKDSIKVVAHTATNTTEATTEEAHGHGEPKDLLDYVELLAQKNILNIFREVITVILGNQFVF
jgi:F-type H+-transporting ATPase subunit a